MQVLVIPENPNIDAKMVEVRDEGLDQLRDLQHLVGGYVEPVSTTQLRAKQNIALVDEDGRRKGKKGNFRATSMIGYPVFLYGTVVICGQVIGEGNEPAWESYHE